MTAYIVQEADMQIDRLNGIRDQLARADGSLGEASIGYILNALNTLTNIVEEMIPSDHCLYCANGDEPDGGLHYFTSPSGLTKSYPCKDWAPCQRQDGPFSALQDMYHTVCPCGCGSVEICEAHAARVKANDDAIPF